MSIVLREQSKTGKVGPVVLCGSCGKRITSTDANVFWEMEKADALPVFIHRGPFTQRFEAERPDVDASMPLSAVLIYLANGCKVNWRKAREMALALSSVA